MNGKTPYSKVLSRREWINLIARAGACVPFARFAPLLTGSSQKDPPRAGSTDSSDLSDSNDAFLQEMESAIFLYFWEQCNPTTGIVRDRCNVRTGGGSDLGSIAATGFGLTALCIGAKRGFIPRADAQKRAADTLQFLLKKMPNHRGFFYHWANLNTGERLWDSEVSSVDTAILLCGILTCRQFFESPEIGEVAHQIFNRVDWTWLSEDTRILPHGWTPETGFLQYRWDDYSEMMMIYLLGLGSYSHPLPTESWHAWKRVTFEYDSIRYIGSFAPLFIHQYSQAWFDFRNKRDQYANYFQNSVNATDVHRRFCLDLSKQFPDYSDDLWGITASDSPRGYVVWGGPPERGPIDGTIVPCATGGSVPFQPAATIKVLRNIRERYGEKAWSRYGFVDAFNPLTNWYDTDVIGIDAGIMMVMAENARTGFVWNMFMKNSEARRGIERAGFKPYKPAELVQGGKSRPPTTGARSMPTRAAADPR